MEKGLYERGKRNLLTGGAASCYPFTSFEMCDDNGILLGVNKYNSSLIIVDIFNSAIYKNANMAILGTSGAGKSFPCSSWPPGCGARHSGLYCGTAEGP